MEDTSRKNPTRAAFLRVTYMEAFAPPAKSPAGSGPERIARERLGRDAYLDLYSRVGEPLRWDQCLRMAAPELDALLASSACRIYVLRDAPGGAPIGLCEFDRAQFPEVELKNFGLVPEAQGRGLGPWLLATALAGEWADRPRRIWLHTDDWDHPAAVRTYERAGFVIFAVREEPAVPL